MATMRLFFALWPSPVEQLQWQQAVSPLVQPFGGLPQRPENLHLTLAFLGEVNGDRINQLIALGNDLPRDPIRLRLDRIECWKAAGLACLRPAETPPALERLVRRLHGGLAGDGFKTEPRGFKPHITVVRRVSLSLPALPLWPVPEWQVQKIALVRSRLTEFGPQYDVMHEWALDPLPLPA